MAKKTNTNIPNLGETKLPGGNKNSNDSIKERADQNQLNESLKVSEETLQNTAQIEEQNKQLIELITGAMSALLLGKVNKNGNLISSLKSGTGQLEFITNVNSFISESKENLSIINTNLDEINKSIKTYNNHINNTNAFMDLVLDSLGNMTNSITAHNNNLNEILKGNNSKPIDDIQTNGKIELVFSGLDNKSIDSLKELIKSLNDVKTENTLINAIDALHNIFGIFSEDENIFKEHYNIVNINKNLGVLVETINSTNKNISSIVNFLKEHAINIDDNTLNEYNDLFKFIQSYIGLIDSLVSIKNITKLLLASTTFKIFKNSILDISDKSVSLINEISETLTAEDLQNKYKKSKLIFDTLTSVIKLVSEFGNNKGYNMQTLLKFKKSISVLTEIFTNDIKGLIDSITIDESDTTEDKKSKTLQSSFDSIFDIVNLFTKDIDIDKILLNIDLLSEIPESMDELISNISKTGNGLDLKGLSENVSYINDIIVGYLGFKDYIKYTDIAKIGIFIPLLNAYSPMMIKFLNDIDKIIRLAILMNLLNRITIATSAIVELNKFVVKLAEIDKAITVKQILSLSIKFKAIGNLIDATSDLVEKIVANTIATKSIEAYKATLNLLVDSLSEITGKVDSLKLEKLTELIKSLKDVERFLITIGGILILSVAISYMLQLNVGDILMFGTTLAAFIWVISKAYQQFSDISEKNKNIFKDANDFAKLVAISGAILLAGAAIYHNIAAADIIGFGALLSLFIVGLVTIYGVAAKKIDDTLEISKDFMMLIVAAGATLALGALIFHYVVFEDIAGFGLLLGTFIGGILFVYKWASKGIESSLEISKNLGILITVSAAILLLGAMIYHEIDFADIAGFGLTLLVFVGGLVLTYALAAKVANRKTLDIAKTLSMLVAISTVTLLIGGSLFVENPKLIWAVPLFGAILFGFIFGISWAIKQISSIKSRNSYLAIIGLTVMTVALGGLLLYAGNLIAKNPEILKNILYFGVITIAFVGINALIIWGLSSIKPIRLIAAAAALIGIGVLGILMGETMKILSDVANQTDFDKLDKLLWRIGIIFGSLFALVGGVAATFGWLSTTGVGWAAIGGAVIGLAVAEAAIYGIIKLVDLSAEAMSHIAQAAKDLDTIKNFDFVSIGTALKDFIKGVKSAVDVLDEFEDTGYIVTNFLGKLTRNTSLGRAANAGAYAAKFGALMTMANAVKDMAISIKTWTELFPNDTLENNKISMIGTGIKALLNSFNEVFKDESYSKMVGKGLLESETPLQIMLKSYTKIGKVISEIGKSVQMWSSLKVPVYDSKGNIIDYVKLTDTDITQTSENIKSVLVAIGTGLSLAADSDVYKVGVLEKESKAMQAAKSIAIISETLATIANAIYSYASGKFPVIKYIDGKLQTTNFIPFKDEDIDKANSRIATIVTSLANAISEASTKLQANYNIDKVATSIKDVSESLINIVNTFNSIAELEKNGNSLDNTKTYFENTFTKFYELIELFGKDSTKNKYLLSFFFRQKKSNAEYMIDTIKDINEFANKVSSMATSLKKFAESAASIGKSFSDETEGLSILLNTNPEDDIKKKINDIVNKLIDENDGLITIMRSNLQKINRIVSDQYFNGGAYGVSIRTVFDKVKNLLVKFITSIISINKDISSYSDVDVTMIGNLFDAYGKMINSIVINKDLDKNFDKESFMNSLDILNEIMDMMNDAEQTPSKGLMTLGINMASLSTALNSLPTEQTLERSKKVLKEYLKDIDSINVGKITSFINLVNSLDNLALRLGSLDSFTESFAHKITEVLSDLTEQLTNAKNTIDSAHSLDEQRKTLINDSINKIKDIMKDDITVRISTDTSGETVASTGFVDTGRSNSGSQQGGRSQFTFGPTGGGSSEPEQTQQQTTGGSGSSSSIDALIKQIQALIDTLNKTQKQDR